MIHFKTPEGVFNHRVAAVIIDSGYLLLHKGEKDDFWSLPGGRLELLEDSKTALEREFIEEVNEELLIERMLWIVENFFEYEGKQFHELGMYYKASLVNQHAELKDKEKEHIGHEPEAKLIYKWFKLEDVATMRLFPSFLRAGVQDLPSGCEHLVHFDVDTIGEAVKKAEIVLSGVGIENARAESESLLSELLNLSRTELSLQSKTVLSPQQQDTFQIWLKRRSQREALQHISGNAYFYGHKLKVTTDTLIPRPETEVLVEYALNCMKDIEKPLVIDVGTGSGAIAIAIKAERPDAQVIATDISPQALEVAKQNAHDLGLDIAFFESNLLDAIQDLAGRADFILSNPPYLPENDKTQVTPEVQADPELALYAGDDGLEIFRLLEKQCFELLKPNTQAIFELDQRNSQTALELSTAWQTQNTFKDLLQRERFLHLIR